MSMGMATGEPDNDRGRMPSGWMLGQQQEAGNTPATGSNNPQQFRSDVVAAARAVAVAMGG